MSSAPLTSVAGLHGIAGNCHTALGEACGINNRIFSGVFKKCNLCLIRIGHSSNHTYIVLDSMVHEKVMYMFRNVKLEL